MQTSKFHPAVNPYAFIHHVKILFTPKSLYETLWEVLI